MSKNERRLSEIAAEIIDFAEGMIEEVSLIEMGRASSDAEMDRAYDIRRALDRCVEAL